MLLTTSITDSVWVSVIVDDQLMLKNHALHDADGLFNYYFEGKEAAYEKVFVRGSSALICASCEDENETWLPLLEKAYAKVHGDYSSISGGWTGLVTASLHS